MDAMCLPRAARAADPTDTSDSGLFYVCRGLTRELQHELGLQLFNYDLLCPVPGEVQPPAACGCAGLSASSCTSALLLSCKTGLRLMLICVM